MSVFLLILNQRIIDPIQNSIVVPIFNHFTTNPIKILLLLLIFLPILNLLPTDPIKKFLLLPIVCFSWKKFIDHLLKFFYSSLFKYAFNHFLEYIFVPIKTHVCYPFKCDSYVEKLENQTKKLEEKRDILDQSVVEADEVTKWLSSANNEINEAKALFQRKEEAKMKKCLFGLCPNLKSRYQLSKEADKKASAINKLGSQQELVPFSSLLPLHQIVEPSLYSREALPSRVLILDQVIKELKDPNLYMIGIYGLGGVGKTTLAKEVRGKVLEEKMFKRVVMVRVSQTPDLRKIQKEIADFVELEFKAQGVSGRAIQLQQRLKKSKVLIILDDIWTKLELNDVGIPDLGHKCNGSKLLLTSRSHDVLSREMGTEKEFSLELLGEEETRILFQKTLEDANNPELKDIANKIALKCSGLPLLVNIVAADLKNKELSAWNDALTKLSDFDNEEIHGKVHKVLKSSYDNLSSDEAKPLFLLCSLFGQSNIPTNHLLTYAKGLGLFKNIDGVEQARVRMCKTIEKLKTESLLLDGDMHGQVKIHDVVLDFARSIATKDQHAFFGITGNGLKQLWPADENCTRIVLHHCDISELPEDLEYPNAELLSLFTEDLNLVIPDLFFKGIRELKVLNLTGMGLTSLPTSLGFLTNLNSLYVHQCPLKDVAIVGDLKQLEFLSFEESHIVELPSQLGELTQLKSLNLTNCYELRVIPPNVLAKLSLLEELYIESFYKWDLNGNASLMERKLTTLQVRAYVPNKLPNELFSKGLERYRISIGPLDRRYRIDETSKTLKLKLETSIHLVDGLKELLRESGDLFLEEVEGMENGLYDLNEDGFPNLKHLDIKNNKAIRHIIDSTKRVSCDAFPILEGLYLDELNSLEEICHGRLGMESFRKLRTLSISGCGKLKKLFSFSTAKNLSQLQEMYVRNCNNLEAVIAERSEDGICNPGKVPSETQTEMAIFPNLQQMEVVDMRNLEYIWHGQFTDNDSFCNLKSLRIEKCSKLKAVFATSKNVMRRFQRLEELALLYCSKMEVIYQMEELDGVDEVAFELRHLTIEFMPSLKRIWSEDANGVFTFSNLKSVQVSRCRVLEYVFPESIASGLLQLEELQVAKCCQMEHVVGNQRLPQLPKAIFPNLETMVVYGMDSLEYIWHGQFADDDSLCKLKSLRIDECSKLKAVFATSKNAMKIFQRLEELALLNCDKMEVIFDQMEELGSIDEVAFELRHLTIEFMTSLKGIWSEDANGIFTFPNLKSVKVFRCHVLKYVFPESIASGLLQLEELKVVGCQMEHVVGNTKSGELYNLKWPKLKHFQLIYSSQKPNQVLPWLAKVCPNLKILELEGIDIMTIQDGVYDDLYEELFLLDGETAVRLEFLELSLMDYLKYIWKEGSFVPSEYLKTLMVSWCGSMIKIAASSISFKNLTTLSISRCKKLENLVTLSTAKTMKHLMELRVKYCEMMTEIVTNDGDDTSEHKIIFKQLKSLELIGLSNLKSFCSWNNCTFHFPSLEELLINDCNELLMANFSSGNLITPKLQGVQSSQF